MVGDDLEGRVAAVRRFHRFYTRRIGLLHESYLDSSLSLTQARILYELAERGHATATELGRELDLDAGYLSRTLSGIAGLGLIERAPSRVDGRSSDVSLTAAGREVFAPLDRRAHDDVAAWLGRLEPPDQVRLAEAMATIERLVGGRADPAAPYMLRPPHAGDLGWVIQRHGALYAREYGWDETFEALVAEIVAAFVRGLDPRRERCWIAEAGERNVGCVFCVRKSDTVAQLRLLLVEPDARGQGIGGRLVDECIRFARSVGYSTMVLWTNDVLVSARRIYEAAGFHLVEEELHHSFGHDLVGQNWELAL